MNRSFFISAVAALTALPAWSTVIPGAASNFREPCVNIRIGNSGPNALANFNAFCAVVSGNATKYSSSLGERLQIFDDLENLLATVTQLDIAGDFDPLLTYTLAVTNNTNSVLNFTFIFSSPAVGGPFNFAQGSVSGSLVDSAGNGVTRGLLNLKLAENRAGLGVANTNLGVDVGNACSGAAGTPGGTFVCNPDTVSAFFAPTNYNVMESTVAFSLTGGDSAAITGSFLLENRTVPEPSTLGLSAIALAGLALRMRRRRGSAA